MSNVNMMRHSSTNMVKNASNVTRCCCGMFNPLMRNGSTALGCSIWRNSLRMIFSNITTRTPFIPDDVEPELAPTIMHNPRMMMAAGGQSPTSSLKSPVDVMNETTWKMLLRKARAGE